MFQWQIQWFIGYVEFNFLSDINLLTIIINALDTNVA